MALESRWISDETTLEEEVDSILLEDSHGAAVGTAKHSSVKSTNSITTTTTTVTTTTVSLSLLTLTLASTLTTHLVPYVATASQLSVLSLPVLSFGSTAIFCLLWVHRPGTSPSTSEGLTKVLALLCSRGSDSSDVPLTRAIYSSGALNALALLLTMLEARTLDAKVWQAMDVSSAEQRAREHRND
jgi:hypothetical protein